MIKDKRGNKEEYLDFYCDPVEANNFNKMKCYVHNNYGYLFTKEKDILYKADLCLDEAKNYYILNLDKCQKCECFIEYYENNVRQKDGLTMKCTKETEDTIYCFSAEQYLLHYKENANLDAYQNCIGLNL